MSEKNSKGTILLTWCFHVKTSTYVISYGIVDKNKMNTDSLLLLYFWNYDNVIKTLILVICLTKRDNNCHFNSFYSGMVLLTH